jgi:citronellol/citronellal dehydrogenase
VQNLLGGDNVMKRARKPEIMGDAAYVILTKNSREFTGNFCVDDEVMKSAGVTDLDVYSCVPGADLLPDFFV